MDMRGMAAAIGIVKGQPFAPDAKARALLDKAALRALEMGRWTLTVDLPCRPGGQYYKDRQWVNIFLPLPGTTAPLVPSYTDMSPATYNDINRRNDRVAPTYTDIDLRAGVFSSAYSMSPVMVGNYVNVGAKYPAAFVDADGDPMDGAKSYRLRLPANPPAKLFWSVTLYDFDTMSGLDNGQPFPSINQMDKPAANADGSVDLNFGPKSPSEGKNYSPWSPVSGTGLACGSTALGRRSSIRAGSPVTSRS